MADETYTQCMLKRKETHCISWIPTSFAKIGKLLQLNGMEGTWIVTDCYGTCDKQEANEYAHFYKHWAVIRGLPLNKT